MNSTQLDEWLGALMDVFASGRPVTQAILDGAYEAKAELRRQWTQVSELRAKAQYSGGSVIDEALRELDFYKAGFNRIALGVLAASGTLGRCAVRVTRDDFTRDWIRDDMRSLSEFLCGLLSEELYGWASKELDARAAALTARAERAGEQL